MTPLGPGGPTSTSRAMTLPFQDVRDYAAKQGITVEYALQKSMQEKAVEFAKQGAEIYKNP